MWTGGRSGRLGAPVTAILRTSIQYYTALAAPPSGRSPRAAPPLTAPPYDQCPRGRGVGGPYFVGARRYR
jgi:hypothetical protein